MVDDLAVPVKQHLPGEVDHEPGMLKDLWDGDPLIRQRVEDAAHEVLALQGHWPVSWQPAKHVKLHLRGARLVSRDIVAYVYHSNIVSHKM